MLSWNILIAARGSEAPSQLAALLPDLSDDLLGFKIDKLILK